VPTNITRHRRTSNHKCGLSSGTPVPLLLDVFIWAILTCNGNTKEGEEKMRKKLRQKGWRELKGLKLGHKYGYYRLLGCKFVECDRNVLPFRRNVCLHLRGKNVFGIPKLFTLFYIQRSSSITDQKFEPLIRSVSSCKHYWRSGNLFTK